MRERLKNSLWDRWGIHARAYRDNWAVPSATGGDGPGWIIDWQGLGFNLTVFAGRTPPGPEGRQVDG